MSRALPVSRTLVATLGASLAVAAMADLAGAQTASSSPSPSPWPGGDEMRRELQAIGFAFRVDPDNGDWLGWAPRAGAGESPALRLGGGGSAEAAATVEFDLLGDDIATGAALTALLEVTTRLPVDPADTERTRRFLVEELLASTPQVLEPCYAADWDRGAILALVDTEAAIAQVRVAPEIDVPDDCEPLLPAEVVANLGEPSTERLTISMRADGSAFEPVETTVEGALVTLVLTFRNDSTIEQSLTFDPPVESATGPVAAGELKLIVVRRLEPGEYTFYSETDVEGLRGHVVVEAPTLD